MCRNAQLCGGDALGLALPAQIGLELGEDAQHIEEGLARRRGRIHRLIGCGQMRALGLQVRDDGLQIVGNRPVATTGRGIE